MAELVAGVVVGKIRRIRDVFELMIVAIALDLSTGTAQERTNDILSFRGDTAKSADSRTSREIPEHRLSDIVAVVSGRDLRALDFLGNTL